MTVRRYEVQKQGKLKGWVSEETLKAAKTAIEATWSVQADDEPNPHKATQAWREVRAALSQLEDKPR